MTSWSSNQLSSEPSSYYWTTDMGEESKWQGVYAFESTWTLSHVPYHVKVEWQHEKDEHSTGESCAKLYKDNNSNQISETCTRGAGKPGPWSDMKTWQGNTSSTYWRIKVNGTTFSYIQWTITSSYQYWALPKTWSAVQGQREGAQYERTRSQMPVYTRDDGVTWTECPNGVCPTE